MNKTWNSWKKREIHEKNLKFMKKTWNSWKKCGIHGKNVKFMENNVEIMEKNVKFMENNVKFMKRNVQFMKKTWNSEKCIWILLFWPVWAVVLVCIFRRCASLGGGCGGGGFVQAKKKRCDASVISSSTLIPFYLLFLTYVSPYLHKTAPHHMNRTELTPEPITVSSHPSIPLFPPPLPSSFPFLAGLVCRKKQNLFQSRKIECWSSNAVPQCPGLRRPRSSLHRRQEQSDLSTRGLSHEMPWNAMKRLMKCHELFLFGFVLPEIPASRRVVFFVVWEARSNTGEAKPTVSFGKSFEKGLHFVFFPMFWTHVDKQMIYIYIYIYIYI